MPSGVQVDEAKRDAITDMNLNVLRRLDPQTTGVLCSASQVAVYELPGDDEEAKQWRRRDIEGALYIVSRDAGPNEAAHRVVVINRKSPENFVDDITPGGMEFDSANQMVMFKNAAGVVSSLWFFVPEEMPAVFGLMCDIVDGKLPPVETTIPPAETHMEKFDKARAPQPRPKRKAKPAERSVSASPPQTKDEGESAKQPGARGLNSASSADNILAKFFPNMKLTNGVAGVAPPSEATHLSSEQGGRPVLVKPKSDAVNVESRQPGDAVAHTENKSVRESATESLQSSTSPTENLAKPASSLGNPANADPNGRAPTTTGSPVATSPPGITPVLTSAQVSGEGERDSKPASAPAPSGQPQVSPQHSPQHSPRAHMGNGGMHPGSAHAVQYHHKLLHMNLGVLQARDVELASQQHQLALLYNAQQARRAQGDTAQGLPQGADFGQRIQQLRHEQIFVRQQMTAIQQQLAMHQHMAMSPHSSTIGHLVPGMHPQVPLPAHTMGLPPLAMPHAGAEPSSSTIEQNVESTTGIKRDPGTHASRIGAGMVGVGRGLSRDTNLDRGQFRALLMKMLSDTKLFEKAYSEYEKSVI